MIKPYWSDYVGHMARLYFSSIEPENAIGRLNIRCVEEVITHYPDYVRDFYVDDLILTGTQWRQVKQFEREVAVRRGLI